MYRIILGARTHDNLKVNIIQLLLVKNNNDRVGFLFYLVFNIQGKINHGTYEMSSFT